LVEGLVDRGHEVTLVVPEGAGAGCSAAIHLVEVGSNRLPRKKGGWIILAFIFAKKIRQLIRASNIDIIHFTDAKEALFTVGSGKLIVGNVNDSYIAGKTFNPMVYKAHYPFDWFHRWVYQNIMFFLERHTLRRLSLNLCNSHFTKSEIAINYQVSPSRLNVCYKSIRLESYQNLHRQVGESGSKLILFPGGGNAQRKGLRVFLASAELVLERYPNVQFLILGRDPIISKMVRKYCSPEVSDRLKHIVEVPNEKMKSLYVTADLLVMPSLVEAFGVVYLEAMICGTPVIGTLRGGARELITDGKTGLLVNPTDSKALADAIVKMLENGLFWKSVAEAGQVLASRFSTSQMLENTLRAYEKLSTEAAGELAQRV
jgi:glycosyltransferase involved in cell wall biosynthesis